MAAIELKTPVPGPKSRALMQRRAKAVPRGVYHSTPVFAARAEGAMVEDVDGNRFIDFAGGIGCNNVGHRSDRVVTAIRNQLDRFLHTCFSVAPYEDYISVAEKLNKITPGDFAKKSILVNSGAEGIENAIKIARCYTKRPAVICFEDAFHGRTMLTMSLTSKTHPYKAGFEPFAADIYRIPFAYCYRCSYSLKYPECGVFCAHHLRDTFKRVVDSQAVAAVIAEPILGEGGFVAPPVEFFSILQEICREHGILMIADEVQTGFGRTGRLFACEHYGFAPDLLVSAKSMGGGMPLAAVTGRAEIMDAAEVGGLGGTFCGSPLSVAAALAVMRAFEEDDLLERANRLGDHFAKRAETWKKRYSLIGEVRGLGGMRAMELVRSRETREPAKEETNEIIRYCYEHGVLAISAGTYGNVVRVLVPLVISNSDFDEGLDVLEAALESVAHGKARNEMNQPEASPA
jgi:4-aminobutyrate aminotransferase/(S)-3-amino-2-methylpropionate transaminase